MKPHSAKQKGRRLQQEVRNLLIQYFGLHEDDVQSRSMGACGEDLQLSPKARKVFPFSVEAKCQQALSIWSALKQAEANCNGHTPLLVFKRNRSEVYCALRMEDLLKLLRRLK